MVIRNSRVAVKPPGPVATSRSTPCPAAVARSVVAGRARPLGARLAASRSGPARAMAPSAVRVAVISPSGRSRLLSSTGSRASSPGARKRGSSASAIAGSRTVTGLLAAPIRLPDQATAISRNSPAKSGISRVTVAVPSAATATGPENSATVRCGISMAPRLNSSPPWRSAASSPSGGGISRP